MSLPGIKSAARRSNEEAYRCTEHERKELKKKEKLRKAPENAIHEIALNPEGNWERNEWNGMDERTNAIPLRLFLSHPSTLPASSSYFSPFVFSFANPSFLTLLYQGARNEESSYCLLLLRVHVHCLLHVLPIFNPYACESKEEYDEEQGAEGACDARRRKKTRETLIGFFRFK